MQQILFVFVLAQIREVRGDVFFLTERHAAFYPPVDGGAFVIREVRAFADAQQRDDVLVTVFVCRFAFLRSRVGVESFVQLQNFWRDALRRHDKVHHAGERRALRHAFVCRRFLVLRERDAALFLDGFQS